MVHAQGLVTSNVTWTGTVSVVTTNNVTSIDYLWYLLGFECEQVVSTGPLIHYGNEFWYNFDLVQTFGGPCPQFILQENTTVALGNLAPGIYTLVTTSWGAPVATNIFAVPTLILCPTGFAGDGSFQIQLLNGVTNANYVLQCSTNLVDWTSLSTNSLSPMLKDTCPVLPGPCYYRVQVLGQ